MDHFMKRSKRMSMMKYQQDLFARWGWVDEFFRQDGDPCPALCLNEGEGFKSSLII